MDINDIGHMAHNINAANGWEVFASQDWVGKDDTRDGNLTRTRFLCTHMALVHSEVSEATEAIRHRDRDNFDEELADIIIRVTSIAHGLGTDINAAIQAKLLKNEGRGFRHGGKAV
jgi:NTP pyrophosphatase (non-canonical NTP hydrolase)